MRKGPLQLTRDDGNPVTQEGASAPILLAKVPEATVFWATWHRWPSKNVSREVSM